MKLSKVERLILSNQYKILERLYPEEQKYYEVDRKAIEEGYELHYGEIGEHIYDGLTSAECREVLDILSMYRKIIFTIENMSGEEQKAIKSKHTIYFEGFDANDEHEINLLMYARYYIVDKGRFQEFKESEAYPYFNSHTPMLQKYRKMLEKYNKLNRKSMLSKEDILALLGTY
ncbi:YfbU family protein [Bacillus wiedmannii]|uniref:YfbU family protein n=1 Tax=Bacillus wiedmannii TaxID=1890302 RepID=UPI0021D1FBA5|nr:YfbU family protein [Bacillus wiedmannii]MCU5682774.1 YfbU family protein [Bacillus wiedmannii]